MVSSARGIPLALHPEGEGLSDGIRRSGDFYESAILDYLAAHHPVQRVVVDAGANIGNHALYFAAFLAHERIHAFEPIPANYTLLSANVAAFPTVTPWPLALSSARGKLRMADNPGNMGACLVSAEGTIEVPAVTLDSLGFRDVTLLKLDVENHEAAVLDGARETIEREHPLILIEDWSFGDHRPQGYELEMAWPDAFTYLYR